MYLVPPSQITKHVYKVLMCHHAELCLLCSYSLAWIKKYNQSHLETCSHSCGHLFLNQALIAQI